jgi:hypothetical protein
MPSELTGANHEITDVLEEAMNGASNSRHNPKLPQQTPIERLAAQTSHFTDQNNPRSKRKTQSSIFEPKHVKVVESQKLV